MRHEEDYIFIILEVSFLPSQITSIVEFS